MKKIKSISLALVVMLTSLTSCVDHIFDVPPFYIPVYNGTATHTILQLKTQIYTGSLTQITTDVIITGIVVANDQSGNIYKTIVIQDGTAAIEVKLDKTSLYNEYKVGQRVYIECKNLYIGTYGGLIQLGDIYNGAIGRLPEVKIAAHLFKQGLPMHENVPAALEISSATALTNDKLSMLVTLKNVSFNEAGQVYAKPTSEQTTNTSRTIKFSDNSTIIAYNSPYANFQGRIMPSGTGNVTGILSKYNSTWQFLIRDSTDVKDFTGGSNPGITGDGTKVNAYTVSDTKQKQGETGKWIKGYIVGAIESDGVTNTPSFTAPFTIQSNLLIAASPTETNVANCIPVQLPTGTIRTDLNLNSNGSNLGKEVLLYGNLESYFSQAGLKSVTAYWWVATNTGYDPLAGAIFSESFGASIGTFTTQNVTGAQVWAWASGYGMKMSGYSSGNVANEDWLISPAINLTGKTSAKLSFEHTINYSTDFTKQTLWVSTNYDGTNFGTATWTQLTIPTYPAGNNWTFVPSGDINLSSVLGNANVRIAFKYVSTTSVAATWEIKNFVVKE